MMSFDKLRTQSSRSRTRTLSKVDGHRLNRARPQHFSAIPNVDMPLEIFFALDWPKAPTISKRYLNPDRSREVNVFRGASEVDFIFAGVKGPSVAAGVKEGKSIRVQVKGQGFLLAFFQIYFSESLEFFFGPGTRVRPSYIELNDLLSRAAS